MNTLVIYFSKFGNTRRIAETICEVLDSNGTARLIGMDQLTHGDLAGAELVVAGTPTHNMNLPQNVRAYLDALPPRTLKGIPVAAFDTSYRMSPFLARFTASKKLARKLHGQRLIPPETFHVEGREGPLYPGELERARNWAAVIIERARQSNFRAAYAQPKLSTERK